MVSYYDHTEGVLPRPRILLDKRTDDAHDNPTLSLDDEGHLWIFSNAHGPSRPSYVHRSRRPHSIEAFDRMWETNFSYSQPWRLPGGGFCLLHTRYSGNRRFLYVGRSDDGVHWPPPQPLARIAQGHYQISWREGSRIGTALNYHPAKGGLNARTNLYYLETRDGGRSWTTVDGRKLELPLVAVKNPALIRDFESEGLLVYLKDMGFDAEGRPVILFVTSRNYASGPAGDPRVWRTARWTGQAWEFRTALESDNNYDFGSLNLEDDGAWWIIAAAAQGPQEYNTGGEVAVWLIRERGGAWSAPRKLTKNSRYNHTYVRRPLDARPDFYAFWADGHARQESESRLYFTDRAGTHVWRLPATMSGPTAKPEIAW